MKVLAMVLAMSFSASAFAAEYVTVEVCGYSENANVNECKMVTYKKRRPNLPSEQYQFPITDEGTPNENGKVPAWLAKLNKKLIDAGFEVNDPFKGTEGGAQ